MTDIVVIGGGIAGLSCAAELSRTHHVVLIEREGELGYHSTGRSAAVYIEPYMSDTVCALTQVSRAELETRSVLTQRADVRLYRADEASDRDSYLARWQPLCPSLESLDERGLADLLPTVEGPYSIGVYDPIVFDIDVHRLCDGYRREFEERGGSVHTAREFVGATWKRDHWAARTTTAEMHAPLLVNAAGAWADQVAARCGVAPLGLAPKRRTIAQIRSWNDSVGRWPMVHDAASSWYLKPQGQQLLVSPADETASPAVDARADEYDVAIAIDRIERAFSVSIDRVLGKWAGLRTFAPDSMPVVGRDADQPQYVWCVGQGGFGIQTSPALALATACSVTGSALPKRYTEAGVSLAGLGPARLRGPSPTAG